MHRLGAPEVYADIFFLVNFSMDFASLLAAGQILAGKISLLRVSAAAAVGGVYAVLSLLIPGSPLFSLCIDFAVGLLLCFIAFGFRSPGRFFAGGALFFGTSLLTGGAVTALYGFLSSRGLLSSGGAGGSTGGVGVLLPTAFLTAAGALLLSKIFRRETAKRSATLTLRLPGATATVEGLVDSGQLAREPLSGLPAVILSRSAMEEFLPASLSLALCRLGDPGVDDAPPARMLPESILPLFRLLPVKTLRGRGILPSLIGEATDKRGRSERICIAFDVGQTEKGAYGGFDCIIPGGLSILREKIILLHK